MRGIVKEARFEEDLAAIEPDAKRADEFIEGAEWTCGCRSSAIPRGQESAS